MCTPCERFSLHKSNLFSMPIWQKSAGAANGNADFVVIFFPFLTILKLTVKLKNNKDFWFFPRGSQGKWRGGKQKQSGSCLAKMEQKCEKKERKKKGNCWHAKTSSLSWDYPRLGVQTAREEQNKAHDWRDDVPFIRLCSGVGLPGCRHTPHTRLSVSDNNSALPQSTEVEKLSV